MTELLNQLFRFDDPTYALAQVFGLLGLVFVVSSLIVRKEKPFLVLQFFSAIVFLVHYLILGNSFATAFSLIGIFIFFTAYRGIKGWGSYFFWIAVDLLAAYYFIERLDEWWLMAVPVFGLYGIFVVGENEFKRRIALLCAFSCDFMYQILVVQSLSTLFNSLLIFSVNSFGILRILWERWKAKA